MKIYRIETPDNDAFANHINNTKFQFCNMNATTLGTKQVVIKNTKGNCIDALDEVLSSFPNSYYIS